MSAWAQHVMRLNLCHRVSGSMSLCRWVSPDWRTGCLLPSLPSRCCVRTFLQPCCLGFGPTYVPKHTCPSLVRRADAGVRITTLAAAFALGLLPAAPLLSFRRCLPRCDSKGGFAYTTLQLKPPKIRRTPTQTSPRPPGNCPVGWFPRSHLPHCQHSTCRG